MSAVAEKPRRRLIRKVPFVICPKWLTQTVRDIHGEGNYLKAMRILEAAFPAMSLKDMADIIRGKQKLVTVGNPKKSQMKLARDTWKPDRRQCAGGIYPSPLRCAQKRIATLDQLQTETEQRAERKRFAAQMLAGIPDITEDEMDLLPSEKKMSMNLDEINKMMLMQRSLPTPEQFVATMRERDEREERGKPEPTTDYKGVRWAWVKPDGKFFACQSQMEHIWLAGQFGLSETQAEAFGWVKITQSILDGERHIFKGRKEPTKRQISTVFDWCEANDVALPKWAGGKPE